MVLAWKCKIVSFCIEHHIRPLKTTLRKIGRTALQHRLGSKGAAESTPDLYKSRCGKLELQLVAFAAEAAACGDMIATEPHLDLAPGSTETRNFDPAVAAQGLFRHVTVSHLEMYRACRAVCCPPACRSRLQLARPPAAPGSSSPVNSSAALRLVCGACINAETSKFWSLPSKLNARGPLSPSLP